MNETSTFAQSDIDAAEPEVGRESQKTGRAPPGRGAVPLSGPQRAGDVRDARPEAGAGRDDETMNGEVIAWVVDVDGEPVDQWLLLSEDCGVRATIRQGQAFTLSPPGECLFRIAPDEERVSTEADWFRVEVIPSDTVYIEVVAPSIEPIEPDSGV